MERYRAFICPEHGETRDVIGMGKGRAPLHATDACGQECEVIEYVPASQLEGAVAALRDVYSLLEGFRCLNVLDAPVADLDGARERVRAALEGVA